MDNRAVITGMGVVSPNGIGLDRFLSAIKNGVSGIKHQQNLSDLKFSCQIAGLPDVSTELAAQYFTPLELRNFNSSGILYGVIAGIDAWHDAGLPLNETDEPFWDYGMVFGAGTSGIDRFREAIYTIDKLEIRRLGSTVVAQTMNSGVSAYLSGKIGLGNQISTNSSACCTGTESLLTAFERIKSGQATVVLAGATSDSGPYIWGGFDGMKVCTYKHNETPAKGSRPMSATASGFVPGSGAGAFVVESLTHAKTRGAKIYAEILGGHANSGGQRGAGTMTAPNSTAVQRCISKALENAQVQANEIDAINGHLTATAMDALEISNWTIALNRKGDDFPYINALKGMTGHCLTASGSIECVASVLQIHHDFLFPNVNCEDLNPAITALIDAEKIPQKMKSIKINTLIKASFGFGDVNACIILKKYTS
ncbi:3-oxoacyl-(acyl-carrier-protein) synthase [Pedobacter psychrotolerans]|uniref:3-oxoacyl-[acyl-carrier-protein] synthase 1 n=1 Tax=Pedobacter psychrotolerans TaxID=1843235 RepID=A0A4R2HKE0_9SPHI|nr:beta-ketoacyl-[acyl-carrier-protein] synthase family protein [Pedobacter psychrotolerans]TCO28948.1 3-oxoacyl-(acyl-carrier-protein) synthase [Pedobacter psychrotolerans]GGE53029.1 beta-ketoacyl-ACP synthase [Pedobacter psychrotolerans]